MHDVHSVMGRLPCRWAQVSTSRTGRRRPAAGPPGSGPRVQGTAFLATVGANCEVAAARRLVIICQEIYRNLVHDPAAPVLRPAETVPERTVITTEAGTIRDDHQPLTVGPPVGPAPGVSPSGGEPSQ